MSSIELPDLPDSTFPDSNPDAMLCSGVYRVELVDLPAGQAPMWPLSYREDGKAVLGIARGAVDENFLWWLGQMMGWEWPVPPQQPTTGG
jgi:hypothetical protein